MKNKKIILIVGTITTLIIGLVIWFVYHIAPGSYSNAEQYTLNVSESDLFNAVELFKIKNSKYCPPSQTQLQDGRGVDPYDYYYHVYFYYPEENQIVHALIQQDPFIKEKKTKFELDGVNDGLILGHWKYINKDFSSEENKMQKKKFEERILKKIEAKLGVTHN